MAYFKSRLRPFIQAFIISDALLYSALNIVSILFVVYVTTSVSGGTVKSATAALIIGFIARIIIELAVGRKSSLLSEQHKLLVIIGGMAAISLSYAGFAVSHTIAVLALLWILNGAGWAIGHPAKLALVAHHINPEQASQEWGFTDALNMTFIAITTALGAYIVTRFSYGPLFMTAAIINALGIVPYILYLRQLQKNSGIT